MSSIKFAMHLVIKGMVNQQAAPRLYLGFGRFELGEGLPNALFATRGAGIAGRAGMGLAR